MSRMWVSWHQADSTFKAWRMEGTIRSTIQENTHTEYEKQETMGLHHHRWNLYPFRAHQRSGTDPACPLCQHPTADIEHLYWDCQPMRQNTELEKLLLCTRREMRTLPKCLWTTGNVPEGVVEGPQSRQTLQA